ncbi:MAG TPA: hypothetical protein VL286_08225 [Rhizomicrobium sp.]|nr:hypothetical protein [Rhizomicrobium sp.]
MRRAVLLTALLLSSDVFAGSYPALNPNDGALLSPEGGMALLNQCSRGVPHNITGSWLPTKAQLRELEERLPAALAAEALRRGPAYRQPESIQRQYAGFLLANRRIVYVNGFRHGAGDPSPDGPTAAREFDWHRQAVVVCDGGPAFFGTEYDPERKTFANFQFNGSPQ